MDLLPIPGNLQLPDRIFPGSDGGFHVAEVGETEPDFAMSLQHSQDAEVEKDGGMKSNENLAVRKVDGDIAVKRGSSGMRPEKNGQRPVETKKNAENSSGNNGSYLSGNELIDGETPATSTPESVDKSADLSVHKNATVMTVDPKSIFLFLSLLKVESSPHVETDPEGKLPGNPGLMQEGMDESSLLLQSGHDNASEKVQLEQQIVVDDVNTELHLSMFGEGYPVAIEELMNSLSPVSEIAPVTLPQQIKTMGIGLTAVETLEVVDFSGTAVKLENNQIDQTAAIIPELAPVTEKHAEVGALVPGEMIVEAGEAFNGTIKSALNSDGAVIVSPIAEEQIAAGIEEKVKIMNPSDQKEMSGHSVSLPKPKADAHIIPIRVSHETAGRQMVGQGNHGPPVRTDHGKILLAVDEHSPLTDIAVKAEVTGTVGSQVSVSVDSGIGQVPGGTGKTPSVTSDDVLNQVTMRLPEHHNSRKAVTIQLQPESLGKVEIKLVMEQQKLTAHFVVQHSEVRDVLLKQVTSLHDALIAKGVDVKHVAVEVAPAEKMTGMAVTVDQHAAGEGQTRNFQQFSSGSDQGHHAFSAQQQNIVPSVSGEEVNNADILRSGLLSNPGSLHIRA